MQPTSRAALALLIAAGAFVCAAGAAALSGATATRCLLVGLVAYAVGWAWTMLSQSVIAALTGRRGASGELDRSERQESPEAGRE